MAKTKKINDLHNDKPTNHFLRTSLTSVFSAAIMDFLIKLKEVQIFTNGHFSNMVKTKKISDLINDKLAYHRMQVLKGQLRIIMTFF